MIRNEQNFRVHRLIEADNHLVVLNNLLVKRFERTLYLLSIITSFTLFYLIETSLAIVLFMFLLVNVRLLELLMHFVSTHLKYSSSSASDTVRLLRYVNARMEEDGHSGTEATINETIIDINQKRHLEFLADKSSFGYVKESDFFEWHLFYVFCGIAAGIGYYFH
jgi:hypothetical protein